MEMKAEIISCFSKPFGNDPFFPLKFLQSAGIGAKSLIVPATSENYEWKPKQVATMSGSRGIYILAGKPVAPVASTGCEVGSYVAITLVYITIKPG